MTDLVSDERIIDVASHVLPNWKDKKTLLNIKIRRTNRTMLDGQVFVCHETRKLTLGFPMNLGVAVFCHHVVSILCCFGKDKDFFSPPHIYIGIAN